MTDENNSAPEESGVTDTGTVSIPDASDSDLESFLSSALSQEAEGDADTVTKPEPQAVDSTEAEKDATQEPETDASPDTPEKKGDETADIREEVGKLKRQIEGQELLLQKWKQEVGDVRKEYKDFVTKTREGLSEKFQDDPAAALEDAAKIQKVEAELKNLDQQEQRAEATLQSKKLLSHFIKPGEVDVDDITTSLREDGLDEAFIDKFRANPYETTAPDTLIHLAKRARAEKIARTLFQMLQKERSGTKKLQAKPEQVLNNVNRAMRQASSVNASSGQMTDSRSSHSLSLEEMSDSDLQEFLNTKR